MSGGVDSVGGNEGHWVLGGGVKRADVKQVPWGQVPWAQGAEQEESNRSALGKFRIFGKKNRIICASSAQYGGGVVQMGLRGSISRISRVMRFFSLRYGPNWP